MQGPGRRRDGFSTQMMRRICQADYSIPDTPPVSPECRHLLRAILVADPERRLTVAGILQHPWLESLRTEATAEWAQPPQRLGPTVPRCPACRQNVSQIAPVLSLTHRA